MYPRVTGSPSSRGISEYYTTFTVVVKRLSRSSSSGASPAALGRSVLELIALAVGSFADRRAPLLTLSFAAYFALLS